MGKVLSVATKPFRNFMIESRVHRAISKDKPTAAPKYKADVEAYEQILKEKPEFLTEAMKKNEKLNTHLKDVFVVSHDPQNVEKSELNKGDEGRPLPLDRQAVEDHEFGAKEPSKVTPGRVTLRKALEFISNHQRDPKFYNHEKIADDYLLPEQKVKDILQYFRVYEVYIPEVKKTKATFAAPSAPKSTVIERRKKLLLAERLKND